MPKINAEPGANSADGFLRRGPECLDARESRHVDHRANRRQFGRGCKYEMEDETKCCHFQIKYIELYVKYMLNLTS